MGNKCQNGVIFKYLNCIFFILKLVCTEMIFMNKYKMYKK